ncbi:class II aldolase/adducin family protein [Methylomarinum sp. Ch1-1]|uniref:Class II aldolase/adducin family protein n=1 Tax=Methylomarinum roseum TaxID=3067653 RepID=A0AAU7NQ13_9GAMM|nr:class II aldolase/adducin family protein [Methylomarinum sp. Ch1-1]MDP4521037.1 class II aldolase/adducin family protein [Methylomarinum sp. Ch1-1]
MTEQEGVIKYRLLHNDKAISPTFPFADLNAWRHILYRLELIGQDPQRYDGYGFGNISLRTAGEKFLISGTQTGHLPMLSPDHYAVIERAEPELNRLVSYGRIKPSSEALTHAMIYEQDPAIAAVIHVHCPEIWRHTHEMDLPHTRKEVAYGSVEMVAAVKKLFTSGRLKRSSIFSMLGHEDGVVAFGEDLGQAACLLIRQLSLALTIEQRLKNR